MRLIINKNKVMKMVKNLFAATLLLTAGIVAAQQTETRKLSSFNKAAISGPFDVFMEKGNEESVKLVVENVSPDKVITEVKGNTLEISLEKGNYRNVKGKIYVTYKSVEAIDKSGSGNLVCNSDLSAGTFTADLSGSGNVNCKKIKAERIWIQKSGSGNIKVETMETTDADLSLSGSGDLEVHDGYTKKQSVHISGSGNVRAHGLKSNECAASVSGSGNIDVSISQTLEGIVSGSGNITYDGDAQVKKMGISGSGRISKR
jgi:hypothetical protein